MVRRTSVTYNTRKATLPLPPGILKEANRLGEEARTETREGHFGNALRLYYQGFALMSNRPWTPAAEFAASLEARLDHAVMDPGVRAKLTLSALYTSERTALQSLECAVFLVPAKKNGTSPHNLGGGGSVDAGNLPFWMSVTIPRDASGDYTLEVRLHAPERTPSAVRTSWNKAIPVHVEPLTGEVERLRARLSAASRPEGPALFTAEYALTLFSRADSGDISPDRVHFHEEVASAHRLLDALDAGSDPFGAKRGDLRKAHRSGEDRTLQPYRIFIPEQYDGRTPFPLVVALHGMGGDENSIFDNYGTGLFQREAARKGFLMVCPKGRDSASMYRGAAERDVLDVIAEVRRDYRIDAARIYLMGHSMGAYGTWSIAMAHPNLFAALGPIAGGGSPANMAKIAHIPQYVVHGDADKTVNVSQSRAMVEAGKKAGARIVYVEVSGGGHTDVVVPSIPAMFDFFAGQKASREPFSCFTQPSSRAGASVMAVRGSGVRVRQTCL
jgi:poly(3-hydroxybutyrate) depolymerase